MKKGLIILFVAAFFTACTNQRGLNTADLLIYNATIYTVDSSFSTAEAMVIRDGKILATGKKSDLQTLYAIADSLDAEGKFIYPGFIDAHAHFTGYGLSLQRVNLVGTKSWEEVVQRTQQFATADTSGWITGRGWDQNDWEVKVFPDNQKLNDLFPDRPVLLTRIDGHAAIANQRALEIAGIKAGDTLTGGEIEEHEGTLTGILIDNAVDLVSAKIPDATKEEFAKAMLDAQQNCFAVGLTSIDDCGLSAATMEQLKSMQDSGSLKMRLYVMLSDDTRNFNYLAEKGIIKTDRMHVRGFKVYGDGALGSRGACLLEPYSDATHTRGFLLSSPTHFDSVANWIYDKKFQMCTHAIGDSGNRTILNIYGKYLKEHNDLRWRIEHAQVVNQNDFSLFGKYSIIPSVQPTHATSDMKWAIDRLGANRVKGAYAYQQLLQQNGWIPLGTDFPVEDISPFKTFFAAVIRKDESGWPGKTLTDEGYQMENALTREETLRGMTIWAAKANFEEKEKGSLERGKLADFVILDADLMKESPEKLLQIKVWKTFVNGEAVYNRQ
jgi:predicted amidohydrolase YtcJ